ncbi:hypothetical protein A9Q96_00840 [Rhodobacterales bacterium 52_120_T64]|nr:hypothetical protein A9Q96_00840 [Rhodobacterales bacterium 52_120_T64]
MQMLGVTSEALQTYDLERRPVTAAIVLANRGDGPDKVLDVVAARAPNGFKRIEDVLTKDELESTAASYKKTAGMDIDGLNNRPSIIPPPNPS